MTTNTTMNDAKPFLATASKEEIAAALKAAGQPAYRANQVYDWVVKKWTVDPALMTNLPAAAKDALSQVFHCASVVIEAEYPADDGSAKYLLRLHDGETVECARIPAEDIVGTTYHHLQIGSIYQWQPGTGIYVAFARGRRYGTCRLPLYA